MIMTVSRLLTVSHVPTGSIVQVTESLRVTRIRRTRQHSAALWMQHGHIEATDAQAHRDAYASLPRDASKVRHLCYSWLITVHSENCPRAPRN